MVFKTLMIFTALVVAVLGLGLIEAVVRDREYVKKLLLKTIPTIQ